jgi:hypothetical protein
MTGVTMKRGYFNYIRTLNYKIDLRSSLALHVNLHNIISLYFVSDIIINN